MGRGILRGAGGDENLKSNFIWPYKSRDHGSIPTKGELFISTFPLFPVTYVFIVFEILVFNIQYLYCY